MNSQENEEVNEVEVNEVEVNEVEVNEVEVNEVEEENLLNTNIDIPKPEFKINYDTIVLSGGAIKGLLTLGALQYAKDSYFIKNIKTFVGVSSGAMICYLLSIGYTPIEIVVYISTHRLIEKLSKFNFISILKCGGLTDFNIIHSHIEKMTISKLGYLPTLKELQQRCNKNLIFCTYNLSKKKIEYLTPEDNPDLPCLLALRMTSNLPFIFDKFKYQDNYYIDGGIIDNFPIDIGYERGGKVLGMYISEDTGYENNKVLEYIYELISIPILSITNNKIEKYKDKVKIISLDENKTKFFNFNLNSTERLEMFSKGYQIAKNNLE